MKKLILSILLFIFLLPATAFAHTGLESSSPKDKEIVTQPLTGITLTFNTNLEKLSTMSLVDKDGQKVNVDAVAVEGKILKGTLKSPLPNGEYTVNWKIVGEDGHVIERNFTFTVTLPDDEKKVTQSAEPSPSSPSPPVDQQQTMETASDKTSSSDKSMLIWIGVGLLVLIGIVGLTRVKRK